MTDWVSVGAMRGGEDQARGLYQEQWGGREVLKLERSGNKIPVQSQVDAPMENALGRDRVETAGPGGGVEDLAGGNGPCRGGPWVEAVGGDPWKTTFILGRSLLIGIPEALFCGL